MKSGNLNFLEPSGPLQIANGTALPFIMLQCHVVVRAEVKLSKKRKFLAGNITITGAYYGWTEYRREMNTGEK